MTAIHRTIVFVTGVGLVAGGVAILVSGGFTLPTKTPPLRFQFSGLPLFLLGGALLVLGSLGLAVARGSVNRRSTAALVVFGFSMALVGLAFLAAPKV